MKTSELEKVKVKLEECTVILKTQWTKKGINSDCEDTAKANFKLYRSHSSIRNAWIDIRDSILTICEIEADKAEKAK